MKPYGRRGEPTIEHILHILLHDWVYGGKKKKKFWSFRIITLLENFFW